MKVLQSHDVDGHRYERLEQRRGWHGPLVIAHRKDGRVISRAAYLAAVEGIVEREVERGTCQICLRQIGVATGLIAHHGYRRPGHGWQTASCYGAHYRALEVACDALPSAIAGIEGYQRVQSEHRAELIASPPAELHRRDAYGKISRTYPHPEGFDTSNKPVVYGMGYESAFWGAVGECEANIRSAEFDLKELRKRLAEWKPAEVQP